MKAKVKQNIKHSGLRKIKEHHKQLIENLMNRKPSVRYTANKIKSRLINNFLWYEIYTLQHNSLDGYVGKSNWDSIL